MTPKNKVITIIGGKGQMGELFCRLFDSLGHITHKIGSRDWDDAKQYIAQSDLVIVSVPINRTSAIIEQVAALMPAEAVLADFTSIKVDPLLAMLKYHSGAVIGLHPMFGPTITSTQSQVVVCCEGRTPQQSHWLLNDLAQLGFTLKQMTASEHDQAMSFIQGVEHFITFSLGTFLHHKNQHPEKLLEIASPIYLAKLLLMGRIFDQDPKLYADIIMANPTRIALIAEFAEWLQNWVHKLQANDKTAFTEEFISATKWMGDFTKYSQNISDDFLNIDLKK
ncbi:MAG: bifunctional chorismate mutase/prephenate dehydrogenase [Burkholderiales bacterium]|nr:bifunctional chorismate mutase/prephenate dehydrogenase [Burkholderiales bacterium]